MFAVFKAGEEAPLETDGCDLFIVPDATLASYQSLQGQKYSSRPSSSSEHFRPAVCNWFQLRFADAIDVGVGD